MRYLRFLLGIFCACSFVSSLAQTRTYRESFRLYSPAARQAVAVDDSCIYVVDNKCIMKYDLKGSLLLRWQAPENSPMFHLNSAIVRKGLLYCAHSNYPRLPMTSSVEIFDARTLRHIKSISWGINYGSCTWVIPVEDGYYAFFAHYENKSQEPGKSVAWSQLVKFDENWQFREGWVLPDSLVAKLRPYSLSGGVLVGDKFYCTGHDAKECYVLQLPQMGSMLEWIDCYSIPFPGQGLSVDANGGIWGLDRKAKEVIKSEIAK